MGLGTGSWASDLMTPLSWRLAAAGAAGAGAGSSCGCSVFLVGSERNTPLVTDICLRGSKLPKVKLTFIGWDKHAINVAGLFVEEGTVWLLTAGCLILPITRYLLSVFLFSVNKKREKTKQDITPSTEKTIHGL